MKALYRKYRPKNLSEVVGQEQVTEPLMRAVENGKISHAYLFVGPRGCGKTSVARILAHQINQFDYELEDDYVDIIEIDGASNRGIDNIRELREKVMIAPTAGKYKVYIIDEVHMLTKEAFNALLKTLEEPPAHAIFIMATTDAYKVPVTIKSRSQIYTFKLAEPSVMAAHVQKVCEAEGIQIDTEALNAIVRRGGGSFRDTLSVLDQIATLAEGNITKEVVDKALGLPADEKINAVLASYLSGDLTAVTRAIKEVLMLGVKPETLAEELISRIIAEPKAEYLPLLSKLPEVKDPYAEARLIVALAPDNHVVNTPGNHPNGAPMNIPKPPVENSEKPAASAPADSGTFNWENFLDTIHSLNDAIYLQLKGCDYVVNGGTLDIYPVKKIAKMILSKDTNKGVLTQQAGLKIVIHEVDDNPNLKKDDLILKMSDIMGGEVQNDGGGNPF
ncbi:DNA polymerase III subunit gamma/tau [Candidatus Saccharibacteria bacterium]|nr:DNA polymerase III subunit gamma/tau [Candidatus Saccharibacteria bacterium]